MIQRNALESWSRLALEIEVIVFGNDAGSAEVCADLGLRHEPEVARNQFGSKRLDYMFEQAQRVARNELLCYCNCDIILKQDFCAALRRTAETHAHFLMVGRRWDTDIVEPLDFSAPDWERRVEELARSRGVQQPTWSIDYFAFRRGLYSDMPALVIGRIWWDHWLVWKARHEGADVVDASDVVTAIHQNHGYGYHPQGARGVWEDEQAQENLRLAGGPWHLYTMDDATHRLTATGERRNWRQHWAPYWRRLRPRVIPGWFAVLDWTRPMRRRLRLGKPVADVGATHAGGGRASNGRI